MGKDELAKPEYGASQNFIRARIDEDNNAGRFGGTVHTRFPPEPNGYLHLGHAKSIVLNFGVANAYAGQCNLRFDDTNPAKEDTSYVDAIREDVRWLGGDWQEREFYASDYFPKLYEYAETLIKKGLAYVDDLSPEQIREYRGTLTEPGRESPWRNRSVEENLDLFRRMKRGEFGEGTHVLRAKIDMASPNIVMRDPALYRIKNSAHHRTGEEWHIYPMYDYAHCLSDSIEGITHSLCTLEFVNNRELYDWILNALDVYHPQQIEFARLNLTHTVLSKRKLIQLVREGHVNGWDDPRLPTLSGLRRRGVPAKAIREFINRIGLARAESVVEYPMLEYCIRDALNEDAPRGMAVLDPLKVTIANLPENHVEWLDMPWHPGKPELGFKKTPFTREIFIEKDDFRLEPPPRFFRLAPGREVRLRYACLLTCKDVIFNEKGEVGELVCEYDPDSRGGKSPDGRKVKGVLHWVSAPLGVPAKARLYDKLFLSPNPEDVAEGKTFIDDLNPDSLKEVGAIIEPALAELPVGEPVQFERLGYFAKDPDSKPEEPVFNRIVTLRDTWAKMESADKK